MNSNNQRLESLKSAPIPVLLLKLGLPTMIGMMVSALYSVVDAYFVGGLGTSQMGAVAIVFPIVQIVVGIGMTFGSGAASYISRLLGEGKDQRANETAATSLSGSLITGVIAIILSLIFLRPILKLLGATETILPYAMAYAYIYVTGSILNIFNVTMNNIMTAEGRTKLTMVAMLIGGGLNVILDPVFIYTLDFGVRGAAIATVISQIFTVVIYMWFVIGKKGYLSFDFRNIKWRNGILGEVLKVGVPILVFQILSSAAMAMSNSTASVYGDSTVAAVGVVTRIMTLGSYVVFGYMKGFQPVVGYNFGAKQFDRLNQAVRTSLIWSTIFCTIVGIIFAIVPNAIIGLFTDGDVELILIGSRILRANSLIFPFYGFQMVYMALFLAMGRAKEGGILSISRQGIFFIPAILIMPKLFGLEGLIWAQPIADVLSVVLTCYYYTRIKNVLQEDIKV